MATDQEYRLTITVSDDTEITRPSRSFSVNVPAAGQSLTQVLEALVEKISAPASNANAKRGADR